MTGEDLAVDTLDFNGDECLELCAGDEALVEYPGAVLMLPQELPKNSEPVLGSQSLGTFSVPLSAGPIFWGLKKMSVG